MLGHLGVIGGRVMNWRQKLKMEVVAYMLNHPELSLPQIAEETGYSTETLRKWMRAATGIKRPVGRPKKQAT